MSSKQINEMLTELSQLNEMSSNTTTTVNMSSQHTLTLPADFNDNYDTKSNKQLIRSVLYLGHLLRRYKAQESRGDFLVDSLETVTSMMDNLYLVIKFGIGKENVWLKRVADHASKVWFVTLLLSVRKIVLNYLRLRKLRNTVVNELKMMGGTSKIRDMIVERYETKIQEIGKDMKMELLELVGTLVDLAFVSVELFDWRINPALEKLLGLISGCMSIYRMTR